MIPAHYRNTRALLIIAVLVLFAGASMPFAAAAERYSGRSSAQRPVKLKRQRSFSTQKLQSTEKTRVNEFKNADSLVMKKHRLQGDRNSTAFRTRARGR